MDVAKRLGAFITKSLMSVKDIVPLQRSRARLIEALPVLAGLLAFSAARWSQSEEQRSPFNRQLPEAP